MRACKEFQMLTGFNGISAAYLQGRNAFQADGQTASLGRYNFGFMWAAVACLFLAMILLCGGGAAGGKKDKRDKKSGGMFGRKKSTRSSRERGSFYNDRSSFESECLFPLFRESSE